VLCVIAAAAAIWRFAGNTVEEPAVTEAATQTTQETAAQTANPEMPDFTVYDLEGNAHRLSDYRGKPVILNFWASWCGPCKAEMPDFEEAYQTYGEDIHFLMVNLTDGRAETPEVVAAFIAEQGYTFPVFCDSDMDASAVYGINAIPVSYFIDAEGFLVAGQQGMLSSDALQRGIDLLLAN